MGEVVQLPPRGHYFAQEVGQLAGVSGNTIGQWANYAYIHVSQSEKGEYPKVYSYQDVAEAIMVHELLTKKVPLKALRPVILGLRERFGDWPLQHAHLETTSGKDVKLAALLVKEGDLRFELGDHGWQVVQRATVNVERVARDLGHGGWAYRKVPDLQHITRPPIGPSSDPRATGACDFGCRACRHHRRPRDLREDYEINEAQTRDAVRWWDTVRSFDRVEVAA